MSGPPVTAEIVIAGRRLGGDHPCFVIAEAGVNHNGDVGLALRLVDAAADAGADAVKFQTFDPAALASEGARRAAYQERGADADSGQRAMLLALALGRQDHVALKARAESRGLVFLSSPFDEGSADLLESLDVAAFKIPSGEATNHGFLRHLARKRRPLILSTGMCDMGEVAAAVDVIRKAGAPPLGLLHCVSSYPADPADANLRAMATLRERFGVPVGWSDHTEGIDVAAAAAALGASVIEKHLTLDRALPGPDHRASLTPKDFARMVRSIRDVAAALGDGRKIPRLSERSIAEAARKSLHWRISLPPGTRIGAEHLVALRPGTGLPPFRAPDLVGNVLRRAVAAGTIVRPDDVEGGGGAAGAPAP